MKIMDLLDDATLDQICGGNKGDQHKDNNKAESMYQVGQKVEVFTNYWFIGTENCRITEKKFDSETNTWSYHVYNTKTSNNNGMPDILDTDRIIDDMWVTAYRIERK